MTNIRRPGLPDYLLLLALGIAWGSAFTFIKTAGNYISPLVLATLRVAIGAILLGGLAFLRGYSWPKNLGTWGRLLFLGMAGNAVPFFLIAWGEQRIQSGLAAIIMGMIPLLVLVLAHFITPDEKWNNRQAFAVALGFGGIIILMGWEALQGLGENVIGQLAVFGGALSYSLYGINSKKLPPLAPEVAVAGILLMASLVLLPISIFLGEFSSITWDWHWVGDILWLGVICTAGGNLMFLKLLRRTSVNFSALNNYLVPVVGLLGGAISLGERPGWNALLALVMILTGLAIPRLNLFRRASPL